MQIVIFIYQVGASCSDIVAFLSLHFPYFTENYEECKDMVTLALQFKKIELASLVYLLHITYSR